MKEKFDFQLAFRVSTDIEDGGQRCCLGFYSIQVSEKEAKKILSNLSIKDKQKLEQNIQRDYVELKKSVKPLGYILKPYIGERKIQKKSRYIPVKLKEIIYQRDNYTCQECGSKEDLTIDHIVSVLKGGVAIESNLQVLCRSCNSKKGG